MRRRWLGVRSDSTPRKNARPRGVQPLPAAAEMIRASVKNRVDNRGAGCVSGDSRPPPIGALPLEGRQATASTPAPTPENPIFHADEPEPSPRLAR